MKDTYTIPPALAVVLQTQRPGLMKVLIDQVQTGKVLLTKEAQLEVLRLVQGLLCDILELKTRNREFANALVTAEDRLDKVPGVMVLIKELNIKDEEIG